MTLPMSTSGRGRGWGEFGCCPVLSGVIGDAVLPTAPDDADPSAGKDAHGMWVVFARGSCLVINVRRPGAFVSAVVGENGDGLAESFVAGPAEVHSLVFAGGLGDRCASGQGGNRIGSIVGLA